MQSGGQFAGQLALQTAGVPWWLTTGVTTFGGEMENALKDRLNYKQATLNATIKTGAEILSEKLFGGSGFGEKGLINVDLSDLKNINSDTVGYIKVNNTNINYPVVQTTDNSFYLSHTFDKSENKAGWVFMDYRNHSDYFDANTVLYAHGRLDNTMFGSLRKVIKEEWYTNVDNHIIQYSNDYYSTMWQVFSIYRVKETNDYIKVGFNNDNDYQEFINLIKNRSIYDFNTEVSTSDKILTLSSCYNDVDRMVLHAKLVKIVEK